MQIVLQQALHQRIIAQLQQAHPDEAGGFLLGTSSGDRVTIADSIPIANVFAEAERYHRYAMTPQDWMRLEDEADARGLALVGYYHSHPDSPALPSVYDRDHALPHFVYLITPIYADGAGEMLAWHLDDDRAAFSADTLAIV